MCLAMRSFIIILVDCQTLNANPCYVVDKAKYWRLYDSQFLQNNKYKSINLKKKRGKK